MPRGIFEDHTGKRFGHLMVLRIGGRDERNRGFFWECECDCGNTVAVRSHILIGRQRFCSKQCPLYTEGIRQDITGRRFGRLVAVKRVGQRNQQAVWQFRCDCGNVVERLSHNIVSGHNQSCGCLGVESRIVHGQSHTREYHRTAHIAWAKRNPAKVIANARKRTTALALRVPKWLTEADELQINEFYLSAALLTEQSRIKHHVDHILPLRGRTVSGLHVPSNLRVITARDNLRKARNLPEEIC